MQSTARTETAANAAELSADEILILRGTDETAGAVAHLAAARLYALMTSDAEEPGVDFAWFERGNGCGAVVEYVTAMASYVWIRDVQSAEQLYRHTGGRNWDGESAPYRQALDLFRVTVLSVAAGMETRRNALNLAEAYEMHAAAAVPLKREDSIFESHGSLNELLPHAVEADKIAAANRSKAKAATAQEPVKPMSVGEAPAGHAKAKSASQRPSGKKTD